VTQLSSAVFGVVVLSVRLSVTRTADILMPHERAITNSDWWATPLPSEICVQSDPSPVEKRLKITVPEHASRGLSAIAELLVNHPLQLQ